jgi:hypothetical protein
MARVRLDGSGLCNYCRYWERNRGDLLAAHGDRTRLLERFQRFPGRGEYDVAVGLSGGKDSTYVLHRLLSEYPVRLLSVTYDNEFLSGYATESVHSIVGAAGVEHQIHRPDREALRAFYRATTMRLGDPCVACSISGYVYAIKACAERGVPFFVHGRSPMQMFRSAYRGSRDPGLMTVRQSLQGYRPDRLRARYRLLGWKLRALLRAIEPDAETRRRIFRTFFDVPLSRGHAVPEFVGFFLFEPYDEESIKRYLESRRTGYRRPDKDVPLGHADCRIHDVCDHLFRLQHGVSKSRFEMAMMCREGLMGVEEAARIEERDRPTETQIEDSATVLLDTLGLTWRAYETLIARLSRGRGAAPLA